MREGGGEGAVVTTIERCMPCKKITMLRRGQEKLVGQEVTSTHEGPR